jgi:capsular polysaccharide biosynthesis protein
MELRGLWKIVRRRWWLIALPALAALAYAVYGYLKAPPAGGYSTTIRFTAAQPPQNGGNRYEDTRYYPWLASEYVVNALTDWVRTNSFAWEVSVVLAEEGRDIPAGAIQGSLAADNARSVMALTLSWGNPDDLQAIAAAASTVLRERSADYFPQLGEEEVRVIALDEPVIGPVPPSITARLNPLIRFGLGLAAGVALAFLVEYLDPTLHERAEVERLGFSVLAEVPPERGRPRG